MKFIVGSGEQLKEKLKGFPRYETKVFSSARILILAVANNGNVAGGCSISGIHNYGTSYVKEEYRGRGIGTQLIQVRIKVARKRGLKFIYSATSCKNVPAIRITARFGYREIVVLRKRDCIMMILPLTFEGELVYKILRMTFSRLPETFLGYSILLLMQLLARARITAFGRF